MTYIPPVLTFVLLLLLLSLLASRRSPRRSRRLAGLAALILFLWSWEPAARLSSRTLEAWYPAERFPQGEAGAIVVLASSIVPPGAGQPEAAAKQSTYLRTHHAAWLYRNWKPLPVLASGGPAGRPGSHVVSSVVMKKILISEGVPEEFAWTEEKSTSTYENALYSARLLRERGIRKVALVTEARHMLRAELCFRKQGLVVVPAPCCYRSLRHLPWTAYFPDTTGIDQNEAVLHEWIGLIWYWLRGRI